MARTVVNLPINQDANQLHEGIKQILTANGYKEVTYKKNEIVWKKGTGMLTAMRFIKLDYQGNMLCVSGWICSGIGSLTFGEHALKGFYGWAIKKLVKNDINQIAAVAGQPNVL